MPFTDTKRVINVEPQNLGAFIGTKGSNYKKMIKKIKTRILGDQPSPEEWSSLLISLKFERLESACRADLYCEDEHIGVVFDTIEEFISLHKKEFEEYKNKNHTKKLLYRIGKAHRFIPRFIGVGGSNVLFLKRDLFEVPGVTSVDHISIEPQQGRMSPPFTNLGDRGAFETIIMVVKFQGRPDFEDIHEVVRKFIEFNSSEPEQEFQEGFDAFARDTESDDEDFWNDTATEPEPEPAGWKFDEAKAKADVKAEDEARAAQEECRRSKEEREAMLKAKWEKDRAQAAAEKKANKKAKAAERAKASQNDVRTKNRIRRAQDDFEILGVPHDADLSTIKKAYRMLAKVYHPDKGGDEEVFKKIQGAYDNFTQ